MVVVIVIVGGERGMSEGDGIEVEFGDGARDGDGSRRVEGRQLGDLVVFVCRGMDIP